ncbi:hypothetical protein V8B97DRAFT_2021532 [Scleroderma yunnanense]
MKNVMHIELSTAKSHTSFNSCAIAFLTKLKMLLVGMRQLIKKERQLYICSMKEHAIGLVDDPKKDKATTPKELRAHITAILEIQSYNEEVKPIKFTRHKKTRMSSLKLQLLQHSIILSMIANHLIQPSKGMIPIKLVSSACVYVVCALHASFPGSSEAFHPNMIIKEEHNQMQLLKHFCKSSSTKVVKFNQWLSTGNGTDGWRANLEHIIELANRQKDPKSMSL